VLLPGELPAEFLAELLGEFPAEPLLALQLALLPTALDRSQTLASDLSAIVVGLTVCPIVTQQKSRLRRQCCSAAGGLAQNNELKTLILQARIINKQSLNRIAA
jgi:hypothetical protein